MKTIFRLMDLIIINLLRRNLIKHLFKYHIHLPFDCAEFGVYKGKTAWYISKHCGYRKLFLFDSFEGLPEDWNNNFKKGHFALKNIPRLPGKSILYKGLFRDTVFEFNYDNKFPLSFIHIDSDLYSSAKDVLSRLNNKIIPGTVILFDEYLRGENIAFMEWIHIYGRVAVMIKKTIHLQVAYLVVK